MNAFVSDLHWQICLPRDFAVASTSSSSGATFGNEKRVCFRSATNVQAQLSWEVIPGVVDEETACRFMSLIDVGDPVNLVILHRVITPISPLPSAISSAAIIALQCGDLAVEIEESVQADVKTCQFVFPSRHYRRWPVHQMTTLLQAFRDPFEKGVLFGRRHEAVSFENDTVEASTIGEPDRFERIIFSAPNNEFSDLLPEVRKSVESFNFNVQEDPGTADAPGCLSMLKVLARRTPPPPQAFQTRFN